MKKKVLIGLALTAMMTVTAACSEEKVDYTVAISQVVEHPSLDATREGFLKAFEDAGIKVKADYNNAQGDPNNFKSIAETIASSKADLALGIATPTSQALVEAITDKPVLFAAITDPVDAGLVPKLQAPGGNVTGASDLDPQSITDLMEFIAKEFPNVKKVGTVINESEDNSVIMSGIAAEALAKHGIEYVKAAVANSSDVQQAAQSLVGRVDAIYIALDNTAVEGLDAIIDVAEENDIPFFSADRDTVVRGAFATIGFQYFDHGYEVGQMAIEILKDGKNPGEMDVKTPQKLDFVLNLKAAKEQGIEVTDAMKAYVKDKANILE
ncbi:sugar ABC transporter substrate-binding protein [Paenibacillus sp. MY03]|uniref:ABC transporter substrate-binding protein n=1 Tax=Paenibacillus sp. MY03 TaxID=302980 RepID=UPI000B3CC88A|nr:ABC transporter substrate-binding protein [Paenibacillus sp. MY03]OUS73347.1 sugar ABC transporter substrate-binding protein [Paenibacillus sp. MY03]